MGRAKSGSGTTLPDGHFGDSETRQNRFTSRFRDSFAEPEPEVATIVDIPTMLCQVVKGVTELSVFLMGTLGVRYGDCIGNNQDQPRYNY